MTSVPEKCLLLGNGESRRGLDIAAFHEAGWLIAGCNALYRDYIPDVLCTMDQQMRSEIGKARLQHTTLITNERHLLRPNLQRFLLVNGEKLVIDPRWSSGPTLAYCIPKIYPSLRKILMVGIDLGPKPNQSGQNNLYKNTPHYKADWECMQSYTTDIKNFASAFKLHSAIVWMWKQPFIERRMPALWSPFVKVLDANMDLERRFVEWSIDS